MRDVGDAVIHVPCERHEYPKKVTTTVFDVHDYGRAIPRGLVVHENEVWIISRVVYLSFDRRGRGTDYWRLETKVSDVVAYQHGGNFTKWRNYLQRIARWPWKDEDTKEILRRNKS